MSITPQQVVPWAAAFVGGTAASWLAYKWAPKKYKDFLGALGLLGGGTLSYFLANKALSPAPVATPAPTAPETQPRSVPETKESIQQQEPATPPQESAEGSPGFWAKAWAKTKDIAERSISPVPKEIIPEAYQEGLRTGLQETYLDADKETAENRLLGKTPAQTISTAQWATIPGWVLDKLPLGKVNKFIPGARFAKGMGALTRTVDTAQVLANTIADAKKGLRDNAYGSKADEDNEVIDQTGWGIKDRFLFNLARQLANKSIHTAGSLAIMKSPWGLGGVTQLGTPAPHLPVGEVIGLGKELNTAGVDSKENRLQGKVLANALFNDYKAKPGETSGEALWRGLKNSVRGTAKLFSGGAFGSDIRNLKTEEEALAAKPIRGTAVAALKQRLTDDFLKTNPEVAKDYNSTDGVKRLRALQQINRAIAPRLNTRFSF